MTLYSMARRALRRVALTLPPIRTLWNDRRELREQVATLKRRIDTLTVVLHEGDEAAGGARGTGPGGIEVKPEDYQVMLHPPATDPFNRPDRKPSPRG